MARLEVKPRLCRSSWRACASTHPLMLPSTSLREGGSSCLPSLSFLESAFFHCGVHPFLLMFPLQSPSLLPTLTLSPFMIWYTGLMALFLFLLAKAVLVYLPTVFSMAPRSLFPFQQAQYAQVFLLKPAPFCMLFAGLGSTNKSATSLLLSDSRSVLTTMSSPPSFLFPQTLWQIWQELSFLFSCSINYNGSLDTCFSW